MSNENKKKGRKMFYPNDVDRITQKAGGVSDTEKSNVFFMFIGIANFVGVFLIPQFLGNFGVPTGVAILIQVLLNIAIGIPIFRIFVFKEKERIKEYNSYTTDSFAKFFKAGKETAYKINVRGYGEVDVFEYDNGHHFCCLKLRYGSNDDTKKELTFETFKRMYAYLCSQDMEFKVVAGNENFRDSRELEAYTRKINKSDYRDLNLRILNHALEYSEYTNVVTKVIIIKTRKKHQIYDFGKIIAGLLDCIKLKRTAFRSVEFLNHKQYIEFTREYYGLEAIDLSMVKTLEPDMNELKEYLQYVQIYHKKSTVVEDRMKTITKEVRRYD